MGKAPIELARIARKYDKKVIFLAGSIIDKELCNLSDEDKKVVDVSFSIQRELLTLENAMNKTVAKSNIETKADSGQSTKMAKDFSLQGVDGKTYKLSDFKGKKVYLKFWASWCSICLSTLGDTNDLAKEQEGKDYVVLSVVSPTFNGEKSADDFKKWYKSLDYKDFPVLMDTKGELLKEYGIHGK